MNSADLALFKLAGDTADLMVAQSSRFDNASQNLHNQLDIPDRRIARSSESLPALRGYKQNSRTHHHGSADQQRDSSPPGQDSSDDIESRHAVTQNPSATTALPTSHLAETPVKKKRGRPPKVRPQEVQQSAAETSPAAAKPAQSVPEVVFAHRSEIPTKRINFIANHGSEAIAEKTASARR
jgi:hypothetical protein